MPVRHVLRHVMVWVALCCLVAQGAAASSWSPTLLVNTEAFQVIDDASSDNLVLKFGSTVNKTLTYDRTAGAFRFNDDVYVLGTLSGSTVRAGGLLTSSGALTVEGQTSLGNLVTIERAEDTELLRLRDATNGDSIGFFAGSGSPEGVVTAQLGSLYSDHASGTIYKKGSGDGSNTGWEELTGSGSRHMAKMTRDSAQSIPDATNTKIAFDAEEFDTGGIADAATNDRFNVLKAGRYLVSATYCVTTAVDDMQAVIYKNGSAVGRSIDYNGSQAGCSVATDVFSLSAGDYVEMYVYQNSAGALNTVTSTQDKPRMSVIQVDGVDSLSGGGSGGNWSGTGALQTAFDLRYVNIAGDTMTGTLVVQNGNTATATATPLINVRGVMSGALIRAQTALASSGTLVWEGAGSGNSLSLAGGAVTVSNLGASVFNELGRDVDMRFEGDTDQNLMFFDASTDRIGIGTATPDTKLEVIGTVSGSTLYAATSLRSSGSLVFEGAASGASLYLGTSFEGAGLTDCDIGATSKLLWDSTTKRFSCGTDQTGGVGSGISYSTAEAIFVNQGGDTMTGGLTINMTTADIVRSTSGRTLSTDFLQAGATMLNLISENDYLTIAEGAIPTGGQGTMSTSTTTTSAAAGAGAFTIIRSDGKYVIVHGNASTTGTLWDGIASGAQSATTTAPGSAAIGAGATAVKRPDGRYLIVHGGGAATSTLFDPYGITATAAGPALTSCTATTGTNAFSIGSGTYVILCGGSGNWGYYSPVGNTYTAGTAIGATFGAGAQALQRDDGTFLVFVGGNTTTHYLFNPNVNRTYTNPWSNANPIGSNAPTITTGAFSIRRTDGKYLVVGGTQNASTIYDPTPTSANAGAGSFTAQSGAGYGPTAALGDGAQAIWRQDGTYLMLVGGSTTTNIIDPSRSDAGQFTAGPALPGTPGAGAHAFIRPDGKIQIVRGGASTTTDTYDMGYVIGGPSSSTGAIYETECITAPSTNTGSRLFWNANVEGSIRFQVKSGNGSCSSSYREILNSGDLIRPTAGDNRVQVRVIFQRSLPRFADQEWGLRRGLSQVRYRRISQDNTLYDLRISNTSLLHRTQFEFANSNSASGPVSVNVNAAGDRRNELALETLDSSYRATINATNHQIYHGVFQTHPVLPTAATIGTIVLKRPDGKFVVIAGSKTTANSAIYDPDAYRFDTQTNVPTTITSSGALALKRPDGKFLIVMGNTSNRTNIYDPYTNAFSEGPQLTGIVGEGSFAIPLPNGRWLIAHGNFQRTTSQYDPINNAFATGATMIQVIGRGSLPIPRPDGKWLIIPGTSTMGCALQTATSLFDPYTMSSVQNTNAPIVTGTGPGATAFQRSDGQWVIIKGGATLNTCAALTTLNVYNPAINRMWASAATVANVRYGTQVIQRPDNTWLIVPGGANTATQIYYEKAGTYVTDSADGPGGLVITGPSLNTASGTGSIFFQRKDGKYVLINGANAIASAGTTTTGVYDAGWVTSGFYRSENMYIGDLDSSSTLTWRTSSNPSDISAEVRTATGELLLQKARAREVPVSGNRINPSTNDKWVQVQFNMRREFPLFCGLAEDVCYLGGLASVIPLRKPTTPTITEFGLNKDKDLMELQSDSVPIFRVSTNGDIYAGEKGTIFSGGADLAERYSSPDTLEPGEVVSFDFTNDHSVRRSVRPYQHDVMGVVSTNPGFIAGTYTKGSYPIALVGRVPVKVSTENGEILPGDRLTTSSTPGFAMKALRAGRTVGIVMTPPDPKKMKPCSTNQQFQNHQCGEAIMFVNLSDYAGP